MNAQRVTADRLSRIAFVLILGIVGWFLLNEPVPGDDASPGATKTTETHASKETTAATGDTETKPGTEETDTKVTESTENPADVDDTPLGKAFDNDVGVRLIRFGLALLAAFLGAFAVQRVMLARYEIEVPFLGLKLPAITESDVKDATGDADASPKLQGAIGQAENVQPGEVSIPDFGAIDDTKMALISLGGSVETELRNLATPIEGVNESEPIDKVISGLEANEVLDPKGGSAVRKVLDLSARATDGATVDDDVKGWIESDGQQLPMALHLLAEDTSPAA